MLKSGSAELGIEFSDYQLELLDEFASFLVQVNEHLNLTRITQPDEIVISHYLDSLTCLSALDVKPDAKVIDIGTGAGFPGIPIKIARPDINITLTDGTSKKIKFISDAVEKLGLDGIELVSARAEDLGHKIKYREKFDVAYARALSELKVVVELCLPFVKVGGHLVAQKSTDIDEELSVARAMIGQLGGAISDVAAICIPHTDIERKLVIIEKIKPTSREFPRAYSKIVRGKINSFA